MLKLPENRTEPITLIIKYRGNVLDIPRRLYISADDLGGGFAVVLAYAADAPAILENENVIYAETDKLLAFEQTSSDPRAAFYCGFDSGLDGSGTVIGIIDTKTDISHPIFENTDIEYYGVADGSAAHGTAVAGIAAQTASRAKIICIGISSDSGSFVRASDIMRGVSQLIRLAAGRPLVINISYGTNDGSHTGDSLLEEYLNYAAQSTKTAIVVAAGNLGNAARHFYAVSNNDTISAEIAVASGSFGCGIWKSFEDDLTLQLTAPNNETFTVGSSGNFYFHGRISAFFGTPTPYMLDPEIYLRFDGAERGIWKISLFPRSLSGIGEVNIWLSDNIFTEPSADTTVTIPAYAERVITAAAFDPSENTTAPFSGRGFAANGLIKPDIAAPGTNIFTAAEGGGYTTVSGTSFSAPFVSGVCALLMQWGISDGNDPFLYGQRLKAFLRKGAARISGITYPNREWGYGSLCFERTLELLKEAAV